MSPIGQTLRKEQNALALSDRRRSSGGGLGDHHETSEGFTRLTPSLITIVAMLASFSLLALAMRALPLGTAYAIWTGIGALGAFLVGILWMGEAATAMRIVAALLILSGIVLMKLSA